MIQINWNDPKAHFPGRILALDTSTAAMSIAILEQGQLIQETHIHADRTHSLHLMPMIQELIKSVGMKLSDLSAIAVGVGPGSYTGVRIGVTAAKTLAWTLKVPIIGVSSLEAMALGAAASETSVPKEEPHWIVPLMDARRAQAYTGLYSLNGEQWECLAIDGIRLVERWLAQLAQSVQVERQVKLQTSPVRISFVGEMASFLEILQPFVLLDSSLTQIKDVEISALYIGLLGSLRLAAGKQDDVHQIIPNYTQLTEAEANLLAKSH
ncbi:tRNA (adenosine(37)-N6)-threonylcarbamoyltransferase complex dimerization subunit type 1 TsaB [Paenibacillus psychroresistens]|uniref:tRNA (Adenosine(37)-N6)-threonylcarbamoyltransferase complex dimerization subunit type 1 TsaB n=1 Tax=Paenibacillus psychroresistens TaxID=1778678 RepID=A0A6B8RS02_9BACL|nr:tRNA (adenosine(37)-N6)-threonylcarbamoyltransferase complex dimerization subunit type 1 TsaB [Paenibacillus psychroresistens]QGQ98512.1 tRNA (adenosine(37)-N6)-threonylcarbamoyltransferase complex dimerization subunit type 1 TsaB [Paenibacillus psychroresistens]